MNSQDNSSNQSSLLKKRTRPTSHSELTKIVKNEDVTSKEEDLDLSDQEKRQRR